VVIIAGWYGFTRADEIVDEWIARFRSGREEGAEDVQLEDAHPGVVYGPVPKGTYEIDESTLDSDMV
jgi:hypothetical protein